MKDNIFKERLVKLMEQSGLKQSDLVKKTGLNKATISYYLSGKRKPAQKNIFIIAKCFDVDPAWLINCEPDTANNLPLNKEPIYKRISEALEYRNMTQADLVQRTGIPKGSISQYVTGYVEPKSDRIYKLAQALSVNPIWLMGHEAPMIIKVENFCVRFNKALEIRNMRPVDLSRKTGFTQGAISQWRSGYAEPKAEKIAVIANVLKVNYSWLIGLDAPMDADINPTLMQLCADFMRLDPAQQQNVVNLVHSMIPDKRP